MTKKMKEELIKSIELDCLYDWLCNNYCYLSKVELTNIAKEVAFALYMAKRYLPKSKKEKIDNDFIDGIKGLIYAYEEGE